MAFVAVAVALLAAAGYYLRPDRLGNQNVNGLAEAHLDSRFELQASSSPDRPDDARNAPDAAAGDVATAPETDAPTARQIYTPGANDADAYKRFGDITPEHLTWLKRNKYPDDAHLALLRGMDEHLCAYRWRKEICRPSLNWRMVCRAKTMR